MFACAPCLPPACRVHARKLAAQHKTAHLLKSLLVCPLPLHAVGRTVSFVLLAVRLQPRKARRHVTTILWRVRLEPEIKLGEVGLGAGCTPSEPSSARHGSALTCMHACCLLACAGPGPEREREQSSVAIDACMRGGPRRQQGQTTTHLASTSASVMWLTPFPRRTPAVLSLPLNEPATQPARQVPPKGAATHPPTAPLHPPRQHPLQPMHKSQPSERGGTGTAASPWRLLVQCQGHDA